MKYSFRIRNWEPWLRCTDLIENTAVIFGSETRSLKFGPLVLTLLNLKKAEQFCSETKVPKFGPLVLTLLNLKKPEQFCSKTRGPKFGPLVLTLLNLKKAEQFCSETRGPKFGPLVLTLLNLKKAEQFCSETRGPKFGPLVLTLLNLKKAEPFCSETKAPKFGPLVSLPSEKVVLFHTDILQGSEIRTFDFLSVNTVNDIMLYQVIRKPIRHYTSNLRTQTQHKPIIFVAVYDKYIKNHYCTMRINKNTSYYSKLK